MTNDEIRALLALADKATPGPWRDLDHAVGGDENGGTYVVVAVTPCLKSPGNSARWKQWSQDRAFIARACNALPVLCVEVLTLRDEVEKLRKLDAEAATHVESVICMRTGFTGQPPYVGWEGLGLALREALDERDRLRERVRELEGAQS